MFSWEFCKICKNTFLKNFSGRLFFKIQVLDAESAVALHLYKRIPPYSSKICPNFLRTAMSRMWAIAFTKFLSVWSIFWLKEALKKPNKMGEECKKWPEKRIKADKKQKFPEMFISKKIHKPFFRQLTGLTITTILLLKLK